MVVIKSWVRSRGVVCRDACGTGQSTQHWCRFQGHMWLQETCEQTNVGMKSGYMQSACGNCSVQPDDFQTYCILSYWAWRLSQSGLKTWFGFARSAHGPSDNLHLALSKSSSLGRQRTTFEIEDCSGFNKEVSLPRALEFRSRWCRCGLTLALSSVVCIQRPSNP